jgi:hypothetical protein
MTNEAVTIARATSRVTADKDREAVELLVRPWSAAAIDTFEAGVRFVTDMQRNAARGIAFEPAQAVVGASADLTRDVGAACASCARWLLNA